MKEKRETKRETRFFKLSELRVKRDDDKPPRIEGNAAVFNLLSENLGGFVERIQPKAFANALKKSDTRSLFNHDSNYVIGRESSGTLILKETKAGLHMDAEPPDTQWARDLLVSIERGDIKEQSFSFDIKTDSWERGENPNDLEIRTIIEVDNLYDVGPVTFPAYPDTTVAKRSLDEFRTNSANAEQGANVQIENEDLDIDMMLSRNKKREK